MSRENVLITGGAGYIGSVLTERLLEEGYNVTCFDNLQFGPQSLMHLVGRRGFDFVYGDVRNKVTLREIIQEKDVIIPLAGIVGMPQCKDNPVDAWMVNRDAIINLNDFRSKDQKLLYPNTNSGYGTTTGEVFCTEETPLGPLSIYGKSKCEAEEALLSSDKGAVTFRLATAFGMSPRMRTDLMANYFVFKAYSDGFLSVFEKDFKRNFIHVKDIADCFVHGIENYGNMVGNAYNLGIDSANMTKEQLVQRIQKQIPNFSVTYDNSKADVDKRNYIVSNDKLRKAGFEAKLDIDYGIKEMIKGYELMFAKEVFRQ